MKAVFVLPGGQMELWDWGPRVPVLSGSCAQRLLSFCSRRADLSILGCYLGLCLERHPRTYTEQRSPRTGTHWAPCRHSPSNSVIRQHE